MSCKKDCSEDTCPFAFTYESENVQQYGCIPSRIDIVNMRLKHDKTWACHNDLTKPCVGAINYLKEKNLPYKVIDKNLITVEDDWENYR